MKRKLFVAALMSLLFLSDNIFAQNFVSTAPQKKNVLIEEFTGRNCGYCPDGHIIANGIVHDNPGRAWAVNVHAGGYAPTSYPNFNVTESEQIMYAFNVTGFPSGVVNRSTADAVSRGSWQSYANQELNQSAICNVGGQVVIDEENRIANITVEVYYTASSGYSTNYLNIIMLQDSIFGTQSGGYANPEQYVNGTYCHMHILRDAVTSMWGDQISPTNVGSLITKQYTYEIPQSIGSPNGVEVDLDNIYFLAFVTERYQGTPTRPILNVNELYRIEGSSQNISPKIVSIIPSSKFSCSNEKLITVSVNNAGTETITSLELEVSVNNGTPIKQTWQGSIPQYQTKSVDVEVDLEPGTNTIKVDIVKANNMSCETSSTKTVENEGWSDVEINSMEEEVTIEIMQDKYGAQITWKLLASDESVIASGGPYTNLSGASATELHEVKAVLSAGECVKFVIEDSMNNGICCNYGDGYYRIVNANGIVILDGDGAFGSKAEHVMSVVYSEITMENIEAQICEGESYTEYGFELIELDAGIYHEQNFYDDILYVLELTVVSNPEVVIEGDAEISVMGETATLTASGADSYLWSTGETTATITVEPEETTSYSVIGTKDGCEGSAEFTVVVTVGLEENENNNANIYPNPTSGNMQIESKGMREISVFMPNGQCLENIIVNEDVYALDMSRYKSGVYYLRITNSDSVRVYKTIKL